MRVHIIQECYGGIPEVPQVYFDESEAAAVFVQTADKLGLTLDKEDHIVSAADLAVDMRKFGPPNYAYISNFGGEQELRWWFQSDNL